jgi:hypothetical protein
MKKRLGARLGIYMINKCQVSKRINPACRNQLTIQHPIFKVVKIESNGKNESHIYTTWQYYVLCMEIMKPQELIEIYLFQV